MGRNALSLTLAAVLLAGCEANVGQMFSFDKDVPDEFAVVKRAPLTLPPDYGLRPPLGAGAQVGAQSARDSARSALIGATALTPRQRERAIAEAVAEGQDPAEVSLVAAAGGLGVNPEIRQIVDEESASLARESESFIDTLVFWREPEPPGTVVDASSEARRLQENTGLGREVTDGRTPMIRRERETSPFRWPF